MERKRVKGKKMGSSRKLMMKPENTDELKTETTPESEDTIFNEMADKIQKLFSEDDPSSSIFITRDDMKKVSDIIFCTLEDLELLFDELNNEGKGYLTYEEFTSGLKNFINSASGQWNQTRKRKSTKRITGLTQFPSLEEADTDERKQFKSFMEHLGAHNVFEDESEIWKLWTRLSHEEPHLLENLEEFLEKVTNQIKEAKKEKETLELILKKRIAEHNEEVQHLYEEMEQQMSEEINKLTNESHARSNVHNQEMKNVIDVKNKEVHQLVSVQNELESELHKLQSTEQVTKSENEMLKRTNQDLQFQLEKIRDQLSEAQVCLSEMKQKMIQHENKEETIDNEELENISSAQDANQKEKNSESESEQSHLEEPAEFVQKNLTDCPNNLRTRVISIEEDPIAECLLKHPNLLKVTIAEETPTQEQPNTQILNPEGQRIYFNKGGNFISQSDTEQENNDSILQKETPSQDKLLKDVSIEQKIKDKTDPIAILQEQMVKVTIKANDGQKEQDIPPPEKSGYHEENYRNPDCVYKIMFVGNSYVGKTAFLHRVHEESYKRDMSSTIGIDYRVKIVTVDDKRYALQLWDTAGQERFLSMTQQFFRNADGMVIMYDVTSRESFNAVQHWLNCIHEKVMDDIVILLVGNKIDCASERKVSYVDGMQLAQEHKLLFIECSAASGINIKESLIQIVRSLKEHEDDMKNNVVKIRSTSSNKNYCCM